MNRLRIYAHAAGMTLIELVIAIAVAGIAVAGLASAFASIVTRTADPMIQVQAQVAAESLLEEIVLKPFADPVTSSVCGTAPSDREDFNDVCDYHNYTSTGIEDQEGNPVAGLENYAASITVVPTALGSGSNSGLAPDGNQIASSDALLITVSVTSPLGASVVFSSFRTNY